MRDYVHIINFCIIIIVIVIMLELPLLTKLNYVIYV